MGEGGGMEEMEEEETFTWEEHGRGAFLCLDEMRREGEQVDLMVRGEDGPEIGCHKLVLASVSPYFRAMIRSQEVGREVRVMGVEGEALATIVNACYTGRINLSLDTVASLLAAADLFLIDWIINKCSSFLMDRLHLENCVTVGRLARLYRLSELSSAVRRFMESEFRALVSSDELFELEADELADLLASDGLVGDEEEVVSSVARWLNQDLANPPTKSNDHLVSLLRISLCSGEFLERMEKEELFGVIRDSEAFKLQKNSTLDRDHLSVGRRCRGTNDIMVVHHDASDKLFGYNTSSSMWQAISEIPAGSGFEYAALAASPTSLFLVGGRSREGQTLRSVFSLQLATMTWKRLPDMKEVRWYHGAAVIGCRLYAVAGCGQLDSVEYLDLESEGGRRPAENANVESSHWQLACPMAHPRHLPGVGVLGTKIYVCGGTDDSWTAHATVEALDTMTGLWQTLPDLLVPRVQPTVVGCGGKLFVLGGRNSNKVELMSAERFDPEAGKWEMVKEMHRKRWGAGAAVLHRRLLP